MNRRSSRELRRRLKAPAPEAPPELLQRLKEAIPEERFGEAEPISEAKPSRRAGAWGQREWGIAAGVVMLVASGLLAIRLGSRDVSSGEASSRDAVAQSQEQPIDAVAPEVGADRAQEDKDQEDKDQASDSATPGPAMVPLSEASESDDEGTSAQDLAVERENDLEPRRQLSRTQRSKADAPKPSEKARAEAEPLVDAVAKKEAPSAVEEQLLRAQPRVSQAPAQDERRSGEEQRVATATTSAPAAVAVGAQGAALERPLALQISRQRVENGVWQLDGTVGEGGARSDFAGAAGPLVLRLVSAPEPRARRAADRDLAAREMAQDEMTQDTGRQDAPVADRRDPIRAAVDPNGRFSLRIPCEAIGPSEETLVLELLDEEGTELERIEVPAPASCVTGSGEPQ